MSKTQQQEHSTSLLSDQILIQCWEVVRGGPTTEEYMPEGKIKQWLNRVVAEKGIADQFGNVEFHQQMQIYMKEVHELNRDTITNVMLKFQQAVEFFEWLLQRFPNQLQRQHDQHQKQQSCEQSVHHNKPDAKFDNKAEQIVENSEKHHKNYPNKQVHSVKKLQDDSQEVKKHQQQQENYFQPPQNDNGEQENGADPKGEQNQEGNQFVERQISNENEEQKAQQGGISKNYKEYINVIFDHYCRMSYATGSDPTFQTIQQKTQVMTINKFMIFCKDFNILKLNSMSRNLLVQMFKKNSQFYKDMNFDQFFTVLLKVSFMVYGPDNAETPTENSKQFQQMLLFLQVNSLKAFKKKMAVLNIPYRVRGDNKQNPRQNQANKPVLNINRTKHIIGGVNGRSEQQVKEQIQMRKKIRSQNKLQVIQKIKVKNLPSKKSMSSNKHMPSSTYDDIQKPQIKSVNPTKKLAPPVPPTRKISSTKNKIQIGQQFVGVTGYANIHRLKQIGKAGNIQSKLRLNSIVQEAKKMVHAERNDIQSDYGPSNRTSNYGTSTPYSEFRPAGNTHNNLLEQFYDRDMVQSQQSNYSQRDSAYENPLSKRNYVAHGHSQLQKRSKPSEHQEELKGIIDQDSDRDEFLEQHLNREKKTGVMNKRIEKKIKQFELRDAQ